MLLSQHTSAPGHFLSSKVSSRDRKPSFSFQFVYVIDSHSADVDLNSTNSSKRWTQSCVDAPFLFLKSPLFSAFLPLKKLDSVSPSWFRILQPSRSNPAAWLFSFYKSLSNKISVTHLCPVNPTPNRRRHIRNERRQMKYLTFLTKILTYFCGDAAPLTLLIRAVL